MSSRYSVSDSLWSRKNPSVGISTVWKGSLGILTFCKKEIVRMRPVAHVYLLSFVCEISLASSSTHLTRSHELLTIMLRRAEDIILAIEFHIALGKR